MAEVKELTLELALNNQKLITGLKQTDAAFNKVQGKTSAVTSGINGMKAAWAAAAAVISGVVVQSLTKFINKAAEFEQVQTSFATFLGSAQKAKVVLRDLEKFAIVTPYTNDQVFKASKTLLAFGTAAEDLQPTLRLIGDVAAGTGKDLSEMAVIFGQIKSTGRLMGQDLLQLINAGFNPLQVISQKTGRSMSDLKDDMEKGLITFDMVQGAFETATGKGGLFFDMMNKQSQTLSGRLSTLQGNWDIIQRTIGEQLAPIVGKWVDMGNAITQNADNLKTFKTVVISVVALARLVPQTLATGFEAFKAFLSPLISTVKALFESVQAIGNKELPIEKKIEQVKNAFAKIPAETGKSIQDSAKAVADGYTTIFTDAVDQIKKLDDTVKGSINDFPKTTKAAAEVSMKQTQETFTRYLDIAKTALSGFNNIFAGLQENQSIEFENEQIRQTNALKARLDQGLISEEEFAKQKEQIDKETAKKKAEAEQKNAIAKKALSLTEIALSTAMGIVNALTLPFPLNWIQAGLVGAMGGVQAGIAAAQPIPEIPTFAQGGIIEDVAGPAIKGEDGMIAVQRGESVLNRAATAVLGADAIDAINSGRGIAPNVVINVTSNNGREVVQVLNEYFRQYGTSNRGQAT